MNRKIQFALVVGLLAATVSARAQQLPKRIISVSPNVTELLYAVGAFDRVVAVSDYCIYPPAVQKLPRVGGWQDTNLEKLTALQPDLVIVTDAQAPLIGDKLQALGLRWMVV